MLEWNPLNVYFKWTWSSLKNLLKPICTKLPLYPDKVKNELIVKYEAQHILIYTCIFEEKNSSEIEVKK